MSKEKRKISSVSDENLIRLNRFILRHGICCVRCMHHFQPTFTPDEQTGRQAQSILFSSHADKNLSYRNNLLDLRHITHNYPFQEYSLQFSVL